MTAPLAPEPFGPVVITPREIYDAVVRVSAKVDMLGVQMQAYEADRVDDEKRHHEAHAAYERRITAIEKRLWPLPSASLLVAIAAVAVAILYR